jgi:uncharacterized protein DUF6881
MQHWRVEWHHDFPNDPVLIHSEIGPDGYERRKVETFRDGRRSWADSAHEHGTTWLGTVPVGRIEDVDAQAEFSAGLITREEFETAWSAATAGGVSPARPGAWP